jgi:ABC-2 type transport system ATP-binding protein
MSAIELQSVTKQYGSHQAVHDLTFDVERGEVFGFLGPNGAGKSTTINMLLDFVRPSAGDVAVLGHDPQAETRTVREQVGVLPEASGYYDRSTARDHIDFAIAMKDANDDAEALLDRVGIADVADQPVGGFSTGMRKRLGLAIALIGDPDLLILDEPLAGLDPNGARLFRDIVRTERDRGATVFLSSHIMDEIKTLCDRVGILNDGELVALDTIDQLRASVSGSDTFIVTLAATPDDHNVEALDGVTDVAVQDDTLRVSCTDPTVKADIVTHLDSIGTTILEIDSESVSMEELFMQIVDGGMEG